MRHDQNDPMDTYPYRPKNQGRRPSQEGSSVLIMEIVVTVLMLGFAIYMILNPTHNQ